MAKQTKRTERPGLSDTLIEEAYQLNEMFDKGGLKGWRERRYYESALGIIENYKKDYWESFDFPIRREKLDLLLVGKPRLVHDQYKLAKGLAAKYNLHPALVSVLDSEYKGFCKGLADFKKKFANYKRRETRKKNKKD